MSHYKTLHTCYTLLIHVDLLYSGTNKRYHSVNFKSINFLFYVLTTVNKLTRFLKKEDR